MKLKKVTALLLATSMVLSSVNVAPIFAEEPEQVDFFIEEDAGSEEDASVNADFGGEEALVVEEAPVVEDAPDQIIEEENYVEDASQDVFLTEVAEEPVSDDVQQILDLVEEDVNISETAAANSDYANIFNDSLVSVVYKQSIGTWTKADPVTLNVLYSGNPVYWVGAVTEVQYDGAPVDKDHYTISAGTATDIGEYTVELTITQPAGSENTCLGTVEIPWEIVGLTEEGNEVEAATYDPSTSVRDLIEAANPTLYATLMPNSATKDGETILANTNNKFMANYWDKVDDWFDVGEYKLICGLSGTFNCYGENGAAKDIEKSPVITVTINQKALTAQTVLTSNLGAEADPIANESEIDYDPTRTSVAVTYKYLDSEGNEDATAEADTDIGTAKITTTIKNSIDESLATTIEPVQADTYTVTSVLPTEGETPVTSDNYTLAWAETEGSEVSFTVNQVAITPEVVVKDATGTVVDTATYDGTPFSVDFADTMANKDLVELYADPAVETDKVSETEAGAYTASIRFVDEDSEINYTLNPTSVNWSIEKAPVEDVTWKYRAASETDWTTASELEVARPYIEGGYVIAADGEGIAGCAVADEDLTDEGTVTVETIGEYTLGAVGDENHTSNATFAFTVTESNISVTFDNFKDGDEIIVAEGDEGFTPEITVYDVENDEDVPETGYEVKVNGEALAGPYTEPDVYTVEVSPVSPYDFTPVTAEFSIRRSEREEIVVTWDSDDVKVQDSTSQGGIYTYGGVKKVEYASGGRFDDWEYDYGNMDDLQQKDVGEYTAAITFDEDKYALASGSDVAHTWYVVEDRAYSGTYDGQEHGAKEGSGIKFYKELNAKAGDVPTDQDSINTDYQDASPKATDAGIYTVVYRKWDAKEKEYGAPIQTQIVIKKADVTAKVVAKTISYGSTINDKYDTLRLTDFDFGDMPLPKGKKLADVIGIEDDRTWATEYTKKGTAPVVWEDPIWEAPEYLNAGKYKVKFYGDPIYELDGKENYNITIEEDTTGLLTVNPAEITVTWNADLTYTGEPWDYTAKDYTHTNGDLLSFDYTGARETNVGTYTATIKKVYRWEEVGEQAFDWVETKNYKVSNPTHEWKINKAEVVIVVDPQDTNNIPYGYDRPEKTFGLKDIKVYASNYSGDPDYTKDYPTSNFKAEDLEFTADYRQYDPVYEEDEYGNWVKAKYEVTLKAIPTSDNLTVKAVKKGEFSLREAKVVVAPDNKVVGYGQDPVELTYSIRDMESGSGESKALEHSIAEKLVEVKLSTDKDFSPTAKMPTEVGEHTIYAELVEAKKNGTELSNFDWRVASGSYTVTEGDFSIEFADYKGEYDGAAHGIVITPDETKLPDGVTIYFMTGEDGEEAYDYSKSDKEYAAGLFKGGKITTNPKFIAAGEYDVYYYVEGPNYKLNLFGTNKVTILSNDEAAAEAVEKKIEEATKKDAEGNYDADKVKEAREAYNALTDDQKKLVDKSDLNDLEDAEADIAKKANDAIEKALPTSDPLTDKDREALDAAKKLYDDLTDEEKALIPQATKDKLDAAEKAVAADEATKAKAVEDAIAALPAAVNVTEADKENIEAARKAYDALTPAEKKLVPNEDKLKADEEALKAQEEADKAAAKAVEDLIDALPEADKATAEDLVPAQTAKAALDALTEAQKKLVPEDKQKKVDDVIAAAGKDAQKQLLEAMIDALPEADKVTTADKEDIEAVKAAYDAAPEDVQAKVDPEKAKKLADDVAALKAAEEKEAADKAAAKAVEDLINAIKDAEAGTGKAATQAAKDAYDQLTDDQKALVSKEAKDELEDAEKAYAKDTTFEAGSVEGVKDSNMGIFRVLSNGDVTYVKPLYPELTYFEVPNVVVDPDGFSHKVVKVSINAFKGCSNARKIWIGKNIVTIGSYAFKGATDLRNLIVRTEGIDVPEKIEKAFKGAGKKNGKNFTVHVHDTKLAAYNEMFYGIGGLSINAQMVAIEAPND
jgi:hypothetical protein